MLAIQGPRSREVLEKSKLLGDLPGRLGDLQYYHFVSGEVDGAPILVSRTGYTGEIGFEVFVPPRLAGDLWDELLERGSAAGIGPAGLGARDTLRFEVCFSLYGHELAEDVSPLESGIGWTVKLKKPDFIGKAALVRLKQQGLPRQLVGFEIPAGERAIARQGYELRSEGMRAGIVTSGTWAPTLERSLGLALVDVAVVSAPLAVQVRGRDVPVSVVPIPFHKPVARGWWGMAGARRCHPLRGRSSRTWQSRFRKTSSITEEPSGCMSPMMAPKQRWGSRPRSEGARGHRLRRVAARGHGAHTDGFLRHDRGRQDGRRPLPPLSGE